MAFLLVGEFLNSLRIILNFNEKIKKKSLLTNSYVVRKLQQKDVRRSFMSQYTDDLHSLSHTKWNCKYHVVLPIVISITQGFTSIPKAKS